MGSGLDLSGADLREMTWADHRVVDCVMDDADLTNLRCWAVDVQRTSLRRACLHHGQLGAPSPVRPEASVWSDVDLTGADLRATHGSHASLLRVDLHGARCAGAHWSDLVDCTFGGVVEGLTLGVGPGWGPDGAGGAVRGMRKVDIFYDFETMGSHMRADANAGARRLDPGVRALILERCAPFLGHFGYAAAGADQAAG